MSDTITLTLTTLDGNSTPIRCKPTETIGHVRRRLQPTATSSSSSSSSSAPRINLSCDGVLLADDALVATLTTNHLTGWTPRYTSHRSDDQRRGLAQRTMQAALDREQLVALARKLWSAAVRYARAAAEVARTVSPSLWLKLGAWLALFYLVCRADLGGPFLVVSALVFVWRVGFSDRSAQEESAYTVFNHGFRALPGQLQQEDVQRNVVGL